MKILLLSMPDSFEHMPSGAVRMPNGALTSLAGNLDPQHEVAVADLILVQSSVEQTVRRLMTEFDPAVVGLSIMTFQRHTAWALIGLIKRLKPATRIVVGGYDPSLAREVYTDDPCSLVDFVVRGEGEITFRLLIRAIEAGEGYGAIAGLSYREGGVFQHNRARGVGDLSNEEFRLPARAARVLTGYTMNGRQTDVVETSRGCTYECCFCSIIEMRGRNFHRFSIERVIEDIKDAYDRGAGDLPGRRQHRALLHDPAVRTVVCLVIVRDGAQGRSRTTDTAIFSLVKARNRA